MSVKRRGSFRAAGGSFMAAGGALGQQGAPLLFLFMGNTNKYQNPLCWPEV